MMFITTSLQLSALQPCCTEKSFFELHTNSSVGVATRIPVIIRAFTNNSEQW